MYMCVYCNEAALQPDLVMPLNVGRDTAACSVLQTEAASVRCTCR
jgi:hypothetical protein